MARKRTLQANSEDSQSKKFADKPANQPKRRRRRGKRILELAEDGFAAEDRVSRLPDDCLLKILGYLTSQELKIVRKVSRRLFQVCNHRVLYKGGSCLPYGCLSTSQIENGYSFMLAAYDKTESKETLKTFSHKCRMTDSDEVEEQSSMKRGKSLYATRLIKPIHNLPVPAPFVEVMGGILRKFTVPNVVFSRIIITSELLENLHSHVMRVERLCIEQSPCETGSREGLVKFLRAAKVSDLTIIGCPQILETSAIGEQFLIEMEQSALKNLRVMETWETCYNNQFFTTRAMIPFLTRFDCLILPTLTVDASWIGELIMAYLDSRDSSLSSSFWQISVNRMLYREEIDEQLALGFEYRLKRGMHRIVNRTNGLKARFDIRTITLDDQSSCFYLLDIVFFSKTSETKRPYYRRLGEQLGTDSHPDIYTTINYTYRANLVTALSALQPANFFAPPGEDIFRMNTVPAPSSKRKKAQTKLWRKVLRMYAGM